MKKITSITAVLLLLSAASAPAQEHDHGAGGHSHGQSAAAPADASPVAGTPDVAVTQWTDSMELFMEYPVLVAGMSGRFIIHLTVLDGFQPVREGDLTLRFRGPGGDYEVATGQLLREGIFTPTVMLPRAGAYTFELEYRGPQASSTFAIDGFAVYAAAAGAPAAADHAAGGIGFLKEQQWKIPFATVSAADRMIQRSVRAVGEVLPAPAGYAEIVAPAAGVIQAGPAGDLALPGARVARGEVVARIAPPLQGESYTSSLIALAQAERNLDRALRLQEQDAISEREMEETRDTYMARKAGHDRLAGNDEHGLLTLTAPIDGHIVDWQVRPGRRLEAGDKLMAIVDPSVVWLRVHVYERDFRGLGTPVGAYVGGGLGEGWSIPAADMRVLASGGALDPVTRTIPVLLEVANDGGRLSIDESTPVELYASDGTTATAVPRSAVYEDEGLDVVFVQTGGESFAKRQVVLGPGHEGWVSVLEGIRPGERVVVRGGYHVKLASTSAQIGHGHAH